MLNDSLFIRKTTSKESMFYMRFYNQTGTIVTVSGLNTLFTNPTGSPTLTSAVVERAGGVITNVLAGGSSINNFTVTNGESCVFRMTWINGMYPLAGNTPVTYQNIVRSAGYRLVGSYNVPTSFMAYLFYNCINYNQQVGDVFDVSGWTPTSIGNTFMYNTWYTCTSLTNAAVPNTSHWNITTIGTLFLGHCWRGCTSLVTAVVPDTSNWSVTTFNNDFMGYTWYNCTSLVNSAVPDTSNWRPIRMWATFLDSTWYNCSSMVHCVSPDTSNWSITTIDGYWLYATWWNCSSMVTCVAPDSTLWNVGGTPSIFVNMAWGSGAFSANTSLQRELTLKGSIYIQKALYVNSGGLDNARISNVKVDTGLIPNFQASTYWSNIDDNKFISW